MSDLDAAVEAHRAALAARIVTALDQLSPGWSGQRDLGMPPNVEHSLLHHTLYEARRAEGERDTARARAALALWKTPEPAGATLLTTALGPVLLTEASCCRRSEDARFLSPIYTLTGDGGHPGSPPPEDLLRRGTAEIAVSGLGRFVSASLGIVVLLRRRPPGGTTHSYSVSALPGTAFADWTAEPHRWGEILLHESSHSWLNECLAALRIRLPLHPTWYSEWKQTARPAYGILHAAFAFSLMVQYFDHLANAPGVTLPARRYGESRSAQERSVLARMERTVEQAAALLPDLRLRDTLLGLMGEALRPSGPGADTRALRTERSITA